ncbi:MAG: selenite/tellurite reduction operon c-type cytochrome lipoprotein ExtS [Thermodesulfobacteriota bacterium]
MYRTVLIALAVLLQLPVAALPAGRNMCLSCHRPHHSERGSCIGCHRGDGRTDRKEIAHHDLIAGRYAHFTLKESPVVARGRKLVAGLACRRCHVYEKKGNRLAADLGSLVRNVAPQAISDSIRSPVSFMPNFHLDEIQIGPLVNAILAGANAAEGKGQEIPQVVHFADEGRREENIFIRRCGPCHRVLSEPFGGLGAGDIGPNLSGLFSVFYPKTYRDGGRWSRDALQKWLENPRQSRLAARMQPVRLTTGEFDLLLLTLRIDSANGLADVK